MTAGIHHPLRAPCPTCGYGDGLIFATNGQDVVRCARCQKHQYNAPRVETGKAQRSVSTIHNGIKPKTRARILARDGMRCLCGQNVGVLHAGHLISVADGLANGLTERELNDDLNLFAQCENCNLGFGGESLPVRLGALALLLTFKRTLAREMSA